MRTVLVTGANGQLGSRLMENPGQSELRIVGFDRDELDITAPQSIADALRTHRPDVVINAAAYTAVDRAEEEPEPAPRVDLERLSVDELEQRIRDLKADIAACELELDRKTAHKSAADSLFD